MILHSLSTWSALAAHYKLIRNSHMRDWFDPISDLAPTRADRFTVTGGGLTLDFSKNRVTDQTISLLIQLAQETHVQARRDAMFIGEIVNPTERRAALHTALRASDASAPYAAQIKAERIKMAILAERVRNRQWLGYTGQPIEHIVNIGIGGSDLGPKMVTHALRHFAKSRIRIHYVSNIDGVDLQGVLEQINPEKTLVIIVSKTFTTSETMTNACSLRDWFRRSGCTSDQLVSHFVAVSANLQEVVRFGISPDNIFEMWDWVGGRYSLWSAVGLSVMIAIGPKNFDQLLKGAHLIDEHFRYAPLEHNMPVLLGMLGVWYRNFFGSQSYVVAPYSQALYFLPAYLQQLEMESNGKSVTLDGHIVDYPTAAVVWGEPGTNSQHAFFQMLHQGPTIVPIDFIISLTPEHSLPGHHEKLLANCFAQSEALMLGRTEAEAKNIVGCKQASLVPHIVFPGNRPTNTILLDELNPQSLGALIALYEHKTFVQAAVWNINPFDQWGVELGKILGKVVESELISTSSVDLRNHDSSTRALITRARESATLKSGIVC
ncbi:glucose-6-phosphate isomerase [Candidatus Vallotia tarda]|uniref:Glucose-6-phosphate isomerase n=1 Tax=Candidatus Vallotiella hemipterorum TaxID=1177213 RepID=A0A916JTF7_9BURK|nr:glucose-6-phosphate isomerase [Candidatus Vallotia tarda]CAG7601938.1 Glucose-6-phosphate isomerase [Candidatus Vallotia tarda]